MTLVRLYGVIAEPGSDVVRDADLPPGVTSVGFRDIAAVVGELPGTGRLRRPPPADPDAHRLVVEAIFAARTIVPAPPGVVVRGGDAVVRWLELHFAVLGEALAQVDGRAEGRVHVQVLPGAGVGTLTAEHRGVELAAVARAVFRPLAAIAAAWTVAPAQPGDVSTTSASFLVERAVWPQFEAAVAAECARDPALGVRLTGPWPPYDFVRMQFGG
jgi:hypothetical protein